MEIKSKIWFMYEVLHGGIISLQWLYGCSTDRAWCGFGGGRGAGRPPPDELFWNKLEILHISYFFIYPPGKYTSTTPLQCVQNEGENPRGKMVRVTANIFLRAFLLCIVNFEKNDNFMLNHFN